MGRPPARIRELERLIHKMDQGILACYETIDHGRKRKDRYESELKELLRNESNKKRAKVI